MDGDEFRRVLRDEFKSVEFRQVIRDELKGDEFRNIIRDELMPLTETVAAMQRDLKEIKDATPETSILTEISEEAVANKSSNKIVNKAVLRVSGNGNSTWSYIILPPTTEEGGLPVYLCVSCAHSGNLRKVLEPGGRLFVELPPVVAAQATEVGLRSTYDFRALSFTERKDDIIVLRLDTNEVETYFKQKGLRILGDREGQAAEASPREQEGQTAEGVPEGTRVVDAEGKVVIPFYPTAEQMENPKNSHAKDVGGYSLVSKVVGGSNVWDEKEEVFKFIRKSSGQPDDCGTLMHTVLNAEEARPVAIGLYLGIEALTAKQIEIGTKPLGKIVRLPEKPLGNGIFDWFKVETPGRMVLKNRECKSIEFVPDESHEKLGSFQETGNPDNCLYGVLIESPGHRGTLITAISYEQATSPSKPLSYERFLKRSRRQI